MFILVWPSLTFTQYSLLLLQQNQLFICNVWSVLKSTEIMSRKKGMFFTLFGSWCLSGSLQNVGRWIPWRDRQQHDAGGSCSRTRGRSPGQGGWGRPWPWRRQQREEQQTYRTWGRRGGRAVWVEPSCRISFLKGSSPCRSGRSSRGPPWSCLGHRACSEPGWLMMECVKRQKVEQANHQKKCRFCKLFLFDKNVHKNTTRYSSGGAVNTKL